MLEGWELNSIVTLQSAQPWGPIDLGTDAAGPGALPGQSAGQQLHPLEFLWQALRLQIGADRNSLLLRARSNSACAAQALAVDGGTPGACHRNLLHPFGCYAKGNSIMIPPPLGQFGNMGRNTVSATPASAISISPLPRTGIWANACRAQFRAEFFNIFNHPNFANPYGGQNGFGLNDPSVQPFGCGCATPDVAAANPVIGSGGSRAVQLV